MVKMGAHDYVQTLKGQKLRFPDLDAPVRDWPKGLSPHLDVLRSVAHAELKKLLGEGKPLEICESTDCPYFAAAWWPHAEYDALRFATQFIIFLYLWDDETDSPELTDLVSDFGAAQKFREASKSHFERYLLDDPTEGSPSHAVAPPTLRSFNPVGEAVAFRFTRGQRLQFLSELRRYMDACETEQRSEMSGEAPQLEEYLACRMGTSAAGSVVALLEYMVGVDLQDTVRTDPDVKTVFEETICLIAIMNDMFSLRRELRYPFYNNCVAVLYHQEQDLQSAVDKAYQVILNSAASLEAAAERALERYPDRMRDLTTWVDGAKNMVTGNMAWSKVIKRYSLGVADLDGTTEIII